LASASEQQPANRLTHPRADCELQHISAPIDGLAWLSLAQAQVAASRTGKHAKSGAIGLARR